MSEVVFPIIGGGSVELAAVRCDCLPPNAYRAGKALVLVKDEQEVERILADARSDETAGAEIGIPICVRFMPRDFSGQSYGLALALADKLTRYQIDDESLGGQLFATGVIEENGSGKIGKVDQFEDKVFALVEKVQANDVLILPKANIDEATPRATELLNLLIETGATWEAVEHLNDVEKLWRRAQSPLTTKEDHSSQDKSLADDEVSRLRTPTAATMGKYPTKHPTDHAGAPFRTYRRVGVFSFILLITAVVAYSVSDWSNDHTPIASDPDEAPSLDLLEVVQTQINLGDEPSSEKLEHALNAYSDGLEAYTREGEPLDWARTQHDFGNALAELGKREGSKARLELAVQAYNNALLERTRERTPLDWAQTQDNLGYALTQIGYLESDTQWLEQAVAAYQNALLERTRERAPLDWAETQHNMSYALRKLGDLDNSTERLRLAVQACNNALLERTRARVPLDWVRTQESLGSREQYGKAEAGRRSL